MPPENEECVFRCSEGGGLSGQWFVQYMTTDFAEGRQLLCMNGFEHEPSSVRNRVAESAAQHRCGGRLTSRGHRLQDLPATLGEGGPKR